MFTCNRFETKQIMEGKASGATRVYDKCPHVVGATIILTSKYIDQSGQGRAIPFAKATIVSIRPGTVGQFRRDNEQAKRDGYGNGNHWLGQMQQMYRGLRETDPMDHISFKITEIDKQAGMRPDKKPAENQG